MAYSANPVSGAMYLVKGVSMIFNPSIRRFVLIPLGINIVFFAALSFFFFNLASDFVDSIINNIPGWLQWLESIILVLVVMSLMIFVYFTFTLFANLFSAPFNGPLSTAVELQYAGKTIDSGLSTMESFKLLGPILADEGQKIFYSVTRSLPFLILFLIPGINIIATVGWFAMSAWILALQYADYPLGNRNIRFRNQRKQLQEKRWLVIGFGSMVALMLMIPVVNFLVVPAAVAGATMMIHDHYELDMQ